MYIYKSHKYVDTFDFFVLNVYASDELLCVYGQAGFRYKKHLVLFWLKEPGSVASSTAAKCPNTSLKMVSRLQMLKHSCVLSTLSLSLAWHPSRPAGTTLKWTQHICGLQFTLGHDTHRPE